MDTALDLLSQFTGTGGGAEHALVNFGVAAIFWALLLAMAKVAPGHADDRTARLLVLGFTLALSRELVMLTVKVLEAYETFTPEQLHLVFPPLEHALSNLGLAIIAGVYAARLTGDTDRWLTFVRRSTGFLALVYVSTASWWAWFSAQNPDVKFGQTWTDWAFRITTSVVLAIAIIAIVRGAKKTTVRNVIVVSLTLFFFNEFLKIVDMAYDEQYEPTFAVIRHSLFLLALPLLAYAYIKDEAKKLSGLLHNLESAVEARTMDLEEANARLEESSKTDPLTGVGNRGAFDEAVKATWKSAQRTSSDVSVLLIDVDNFKDVNDSHGHPAGDRALRQVSTAITAAAKRHNDSVARIGGDEFGLLLPGSNAADAAATGERIRQAVEALDADSPPVTLSIGVATMQPTPLDADEEIMQRADRALYAAKHGGRNAVCRYDTDVEAAPPAVPN